MGYGRLLESVGGKVLAFQYSAKQQAGGLPGSVTQMRGGLLFKAEWINLETGPMPCFMLGRERTR